MFCAGFVLFSVLFSSLQGQAAPLFSRACVSVWVGDAASAAFNYLTFGRVRDEERDAERTREGKNLCM